MQYRDSNYQNVSVSGNGNGMELSVRNLFVSLIARCAGQPAPGAGSTPFLFMQVMAPAHQWFAARAP